MAPSSRGPRSNAGNFGPQPRTHQRHSLLWTRTAAVLHATACSTISSSSNLLADWRLRVAARPARLSARRARVAGSVTAIGVTGRGSRGEKLEGTNSKSDVPSTPLNSRPCKIRLRPMTAPVSDFGGRAEEPSAPAPGSGMPQAANCVRLVPVCAERSAFAGSSAI